MCPELSVHKILTWITDFTDLCFERNVKNATIKLVNSSLCDLCEKYIFHKSFHHAACRDQSSCTF